MSGLPFKCPVLAFMRDYGPSAQEDRETLEWFLDEDALTRLDSFELKNGAHADMLLVDLAGRSWRVVKLTDLGPDGKGLGKLLFRIFSGHRVQYDVRVDEPLPFGALKERICASIQANPDHWRDDEAVAGEAGAPRDEQDMMDELLRSVRNAKSMLELIPIMKDDIRI